MASPVSKSKRRCLATLPQLQDLLEQLEEWIHNKKSCARIEELRDAKEAAEVVSNAREITSYEQSLFGWWKWYSRFNEANNNCLRDLLFGDVMEVSAQQIKNPQQQLARLPKLKKSNLPHSDLLKMLQSLQPKPDNKYTKEDARKAAKALWPLVEHDTGLGGKWDHNYVALDNGQIFREQTGRGEAGLAQLIWRLWKLARDEMRAVTLSVRVRTDSRLHDLCLALDDHYQMSSTVCPSTLWEMGPPKIPARVPFTPSHSSMPDDNVKSNRLPQGPDQRFYLILGTPGALTKSHWDRGVQAVLYHTIAGTNHAIAVPREVALLLQAIDESIQEKVGVIDEWRELVRWGIKLEHDALKACEPVIQSGTFTSNETMMILPGGGHAVLTGEDGKVVLAGEWHLRTDVSCMKPKRPLYQSYKKRQKKIQ
mmetsp:Transcript_24151/g.35789  ORF Transcript_24151/g.35789 Transcript_24151/m.35789 type:complete len:424 (-) Transcript_24151:833-2104(-)